MKIRVDNRVRLQLGDLPNEVAAELLSALYEAFTHPNPAYEKARRMGIKTTEPEVFRTFNVARSNSVNLALEIDFPRGGYRRIRDTIKEVCHWATIEVEDARESGDPAFADELQGIVHNLALRPYQDDALASLKRYENAIMRAPTGSGKTSIGTAFVAETKVPTIVIVNSKVLVEQWIERAVRELGMREADVGRIGDGEWKIRPLTIALQQTLASRGVEEIKHLFGAVICDEVHGFAAPTMFQAVDPWPARYRLGISADETRADGKEFLIYDLFGRVAFDVPAGDLVADGHVLDVEILVLPSTFNGVEYRRSRARFSSNPFASTRAQKELIDDLVADPVRNEMILRHARIELNAGEQVMLISQRVDHARKIDQMLAASGVKSGVMVGAQRGGKGEFERTRRGLLDGSYRAAAGTIQCIGQGLDIQSLGVGFITTPLASNTSKQKFVQARGRFCRTTAGKTRARLYYVWDRDVFGKAHLTNLVKWNRSVRVLHAGEWVDAREFLKTMPAAA